MRRKQGLVLLSFAPALALAACRGPEAAPRGRVLLVGIDGASPRVVERLAAEGRLPNLSRLAREGVHGHLRADPPLWSPRIWSSIATGKSPEKHGITGFVNRPGEGPRRLLRSTDRRAHALWNIASRSGLRVGVVNWWNSYPPEVVDGVIVSDDAVPNVAIERRQMWKAGPTEGSAPAVHPESWRERAHRILSSGAPPVEARDCFAGNAALPPWVKAEKLSHAFQEDGRIARLALEVEREIAPGLLLVFLPGIDRVSHWLWGNFEPEGLYPESLRPAPEARREGLRCLLDYYDYTDALIGSLLARYGAQDLVLVVSDHGFEAGVLLGKLTGIHESEQARDGILYARGPGIAPGGRTESGGQPPAVNDVAPTILAWLGLPVGADMDGRPAPFLARPAPEAIASWDTLPIEHVGGAGSEAEAARLEALKELGYIE